MKRIELFELGRKQCSKLKELYPALQSIDSIRNQIDYLIELDSGMHSDKSRIKDIVIGVITAREIEQLDSEAADIFYRIASEVRLM